MCWDFFSPAPTTFKLLIFPSSPLEREVSFTMSMYAMRAMSTMETMMMTILVVGL